MAWGHAIEVPDIILYSATPISPLTLKTGEIGDHAAKMSTPGAAKSGYKIKKMVRISKLYLWKYKLLCILP